MTRAQLQNVALAIGVSALFAVGVMYEASTDASPDLASSPKPCAVPDCWLPDGGFDDVTPVDCRFTGVLGLPDGGARWRGCNTGLKQYAVGTQCLPVDCDSNPAERRALELREFDAGVVGVLQLVEAKSYATVALDAGDVSIDVGQAGVLP